MSLFSFTDNYITKTVVWPLCISNGMPIYYVTKISYDSTKKWHGQIAIKTAIFPNSIKIQVDERSEHHEKSHDIITTTTWTEQQQEQ